MTKKAGRQLGLAVPIIRSIFRTQEACPAIPKWLTGNDYSIRSSSRIIITVTEVVEYKLL